MTGDQVAWQSVEGGPWSCTHRVFQAGFTYCSRKIPWGVAASVDHGRFATRKCSRCERLYARSLKYQADQREKIGA